MRRDAKLGLALGMLVIGFAAAFCFPRQPHDSIWNPLATDPPIADAELEYLPVRAYQLTRPTGSTIQATTTTSSGVPHAGDAEPVFGHRSVGVPARQSLADSPPIDTTPTNGLARLFAQPDSPRNRSATSRMGETEVSRTQLRPESADGTPANGTEQTENLPRTYRVRAGDTLSGIATRLLGNSQRYLEIYEANRHVLSSPNDLRVNLELTIPAVTPAPAVSVKPVEPDGREVVPEPNIAVDGDQAVPKRFHRAEKVPFLSERGPELPLNEIRIPDVEHHIVRPGETLEGIARKYYGDPRGILWLQQANPRLTQDPKRLQPGTELKLR